MTRKSLILYLLCQLLTLFTESKIESLFWVTKSILSVILDFSQKMKLWIPSDSHFKSSVFIYIDTNQRQYNKVVIVPFVKYTEVLKVFINSHLMLLGFIIWAANTLLSKPKIYGIVWREIVFNNIFQNGLSFYSIYLEKVLLIYNDATRKFLVLLLT